MERIGGGACEEGIESERGREMEDKTEERARKYYREGKKRRKMWISGEGNSGKIWAGERES